MRGLSLSEWRQGGVSGWEGANGNQGRKWEKKREGGNAVSM